MIRGNVASGALGTAILALGHSVIHGNTASDSFAGITAGEASVVQENTSRGNSFGIEASAGSKVVGNAIRENSGPALRCTVETNGAQQASGYRDNVMTQNNGTPSSADSDQGIVGPCVSLGNNLCGTNTGCP